MEIEEVIVKIEEGHSEIWVGEGVSPEESIVYFARVFPAFYPADRKLLARLQVFPTIIPGGL